MICSLSDSASLLCVRISGRNDSGYAEEFYYVVDLRPTERAFTVEGERIVDRRIKHHGLENRRSQWLRAGHTPEFGESFRRKHVDEYGAPNAAPRFAPRVD